MIDEPFEHRVSGRPLRHEYRARADAEREGQAVTKPVGEEQLCRRENSVRTGEAEMIAPVKLSGPIEVAVGVNHALGLAC